MGNTHTLFSYWRISLLSFLQWFEQMRATTKYFYLKVFIGLIFINLACFWWALLTAYPGHLLSPKAMEHVLIGFPVSLMGAAFDSLSLLVTLIIIRRALASNNNFVYLGFLSIDLFIAFLAAFWVLFAFVMSGWLISFLMDIPETMNSRSALYQGRFSKMLNDPFGVENLKNVYFGMVMGASALLPTLFHLFLAFKSWVVSILDKFGIVKINPAELPKSPPPETSPQLDDR